MQLSQVKSYTVKAVTGVFFNCLRRDQNAIKETLRKAGGVEILKKYLDSGQRKFALLAIFSDKLSRKENCFSQQRQF